MNKLLIGTTINNFDDISEKLYYLKKHSSKNTYTKVLKSVINTSLSIVLLCLIYGVVLFGGMVYLDNLANSHVNEHNIHYTSQNVGHIRSGVLYYIDNEKYVVDMSDFGYDINDYESGTDFTIYLDENRNVVDIIPVDDNQITLSDITVYWMIGSLLCTIFVFIIYAIWLGCSQSNFNPSKEWQKYCKWLESKDRIDWYYG